MRAWQFILAALVVASCGGGEQPVQGNNAPVAEEKPAESELSDEEQFALERLKSLKRLVEEAEHKHPGISDREKLVLMVRSENDGGKRFLDLIRAAEDVAFMNGEEPWRELLHFGAKHFNEKFDRAPTQIEREDALYRTSWVPVACDELLAYDTVTAYVELEGTAGQLKNAMGFMMLPFHRARLLLETEERKQAGRELANLLRLASGMDQYTCWFAKTMRQTTVGMAVNLIVAGDLRPLASDEDVVLALSELRSDPVREFKNGWRAELTHGLWKIKQAETPEDWWGSQKPNVESYETFRFMLATYEEFPDGGPNPYDPPSYAKAKTLAGENGGLACEAWFAGYVRWAMRDTCRWLAWDLCRMDLEEPLLARKKTADNVIAKLPWCKAEWEDDSLKLSIDGKHQVSRDIPTSTLR